MPLILVVEQEQRYVERIEEALSPQGWEVVGVDDHAGVMRLVADRAADLVVVNAEVNEAAELISSFSRAGGGPGTVVLIPESGDGGNVRQHADEVLEKPFTEQDIRLAVRRCLSATRENAPASAELQQGERLSSEELFGDVVLELEDAFSAGIASDADQGATDSEAEAAPAPVEEAPVEEALVEEIPEEEPETVEIVAEEEIDEALAGVFVEAADAGAAEEEAIEVAADEEEEEEPLVEVAAADEAAVVEEPAHEEPVVEEPVAEEPDDLEEEAAADMEPEVVEEAEVAAAAEVFEEPKPKKPSLEDRLREAVLAGKAAAASRESVTTPDVDSGEAADLLLEKALGTLSWGSQAPPAIDDEFAEPAHATQEEVDELLGSVVPDPVAEEPDAEDHAVVDQLPEDVEEEEFLDDEVPALDVVDTELLDRDEGEYRDRMKLVWAIIVIAILALLAFVVTGQLRDEAPAEQPEVVAPVLSEPVDPAEDTGAQDAGEAADPEGTNDAEEGQNTEEEDGDGA